MGWKCAPQVIGLVRGEPKPEAKHRAPGRKICMEAGKERASRSRTLDRTRSKDNGYTYQDSGAECWEKMEQAADEYRVTGTNKNGKEFSRKLRGDAVIGWAMIFKPPEDVAADWDPARRRKFVVDSWRAMGKIEPRLFRRENIRMIAEHRDEGGEHAHLIGEAKDGAGKYCGNLIDAALMVKINQEYPAIMRRLGWDIEDIEVTDWARYKADPEYRAAVDAKKAAGPGGLSVNEYMDKAVAARAEKVAEMYEGAKAALQEAQEAQQEAQEALARAKRMESQAGRVAGTSEAVKAAETSDRGREAARRLGLG